MTASVLFALIVTVVVLAWGVLVTVLFFKALNKSLTHAERLHERSRDQLDSTLDRLMAQDFHTFKTWQSTTEDEGNGFYGPEDLRKQVEEVAKEGPPRRWGLSSPLLVRAADGIDAEDEEIP